MRRSSSTRAARRVDEFADSGLMAMDTNYVVAPFVAMGFARSADAQLRREYCPAGRRSAECRLMRDEAWLAGVFFPCRALRFIMLPPMDIYDSQSARHLAKDAFVMPAHHLIPDAECLMAR